MNYALLIALFSFALSIFNFLKSLSKVDLSTFLVIGDIGDSTNPSISIQCVKGGMYNVILESKFKLSRIRVYKNMEDKTPLDVYNVNFFIAPSEADFLELEEKQVIHIPFLKEEYILVIEQFTPGTNEIVINYSDKYSNVFLQNLDVSKAVVDNPFKYQNLISKRIHKIQALHFSS